MKIQASVQLSKEQKRAVDAMLDSEGWSILSTYLEKIEKEYSKFVLEPGESIEPNEIAKKEIIKHVIPILGQIRKNPYNWTRSTSSIGIDDFIQRI